MTTTFDPGRAARAVEYLAAGAVKPPARGEFSVRSLTTPGVEYSVTLDPPDCSCPDFMYRRRTAKACKHLLAVALATGQVARLLEADDV